MSIPFSGTSNKSRAQNTYQYAAKQDINGTLPQRIDRDYSGSRPKSFELQPAEMREIERRVMPVKGALDSLERQHKAIEDQRLGRRSFSSFFVVGLWTRALSWLTWGIHDVASSRPQLAMQKERCISDSVTQLKNITERVVVPELAPIRNEYRGRTFTRTDKTSKALLLISVPTEKIGKIPSFDTLRVTINARAQGERAICNLAHGEGRILLTREHDGATEHLELSYQKPGKVDVYVNGTRRGSMWNDDAVDLADAFLAGRDCPLTKRQKSKQYTIC